MAAEWQADKHIRTNTVQRIAENTDFNADATNDKYEMLSVS